MERPKWTPIDIAEGKIVAQEAILDRAARNREMVKTNGNWTREHGIKLGYDGNPLRNTLRRKHDYYPSRDKSDRP